ncbi:pickpocket protein 28-like [Sipha flava]|uniref:Pickpocket protein 28-like n=2 Tax=Sipha flava TaxID=143950 RepID=A0A8B8FYA8_9HEMI|nr:pickpocket protein 28-like [Sipha flava]
MTIHKWLRMFCEKTTSHCMQYLVMKHRSPAEKLFWTLVFLCMAGLAFFIINYVIKNFWVDNPTVMFNDNTETAILEIPFPTIMVCSTNQIRKWVWNRNKNTNSSYWKHLEQYRSLICGAYNYVPSTGNVSFEYLDQDLIESIVHDCAASCSEIFQTHLLWQNNTFEGVCNYVQPVMSVLGICYKINMIPVQQILHDEYYQKYLKFFSKSNSYIDSEKTLWNLDDGYSSYSDTDLLIDVVPSRTSGVSYYHRLRLNLHTNTDEFLRCPQLDLRDGYFSIALSNPSEFYSTITYLLIASDTYTKVQITPLVRKISPDLVLRSPEVRKCYMHNERKLSIFKLYTESNCNNECLINMTITMCSCVTFNMAFLMTADVKICGTPKTDCIIRAIQITNTEKMQMRCNCLPTCSDIDYEILQTSNFESWDYLKTTQLVKNNSRGASVEFVFKNPYFTAYRSASIFNTDSLISFVGSVFSLFLGLNLISIFEILYVIIKIVSSFVMHMFDI